MYRCANQAARREQEPDNQEAGEETHAAILTTLAGWGVILCQWRVTACFRGAGMFQAIRT